MVSAGRVACIFTPFVLTLVAFVCLVFIWIGGTANHNKLLGDLFFIKLDLSNFTTAVSANLAANATDTNASMLAGELETAKQSMHMYDFYTVYLRGSCGWNGGDLYANCTSPTSNYWFNPIAVWGLDSSVTGVSLNSTLPQALQTGLNTYRAICKAMYLTFIIGFIATALAILVGISAIFSRWGSFVTVFFAATSAIFTIASAGIAGAIFYALEAVLNKELKADYGISSSIGKHGLAVFWLAAVAALGAGIFWLFSVCCCSGRSPYNPASREARRTRAEKTPYTYEKVGSPYLGPQNGEAVPLGHLPTPAHSGYSSGPSAQRELHTAYEPFRPQALA